MYYLADRDYDEYFRQNKRLLHLKIIECINKL